MQLQQSVLKELQTKNIIGIILDASKHFISNLHSAESEGKLFLRLFCRTEEVSEKKKSCLQIVIITEMTLGLNGSKYNTNK